MSNSKKFFKKVFPRISKAAAKKFEDSDMNKLRSVSVFYSKVLWIRKNTDLFIDLFQ